MKNIFIIFVIINFKMTIAVAACADVPIEYREGVFQVLEIREPSSFCETDELGKLLEKAVRAPQKGCLLRMKLGSLKTEEDFLIYEDSKLCSMKVGAKVNLKLESIVSHCCAVREENRGTLVTQCRLVPKIQPMATPSEEFIRCSNKGVKWKKLNK